MNHYHNHADFNWPKMKISILGSGLSGMAAAKLGKYMGSKIFISDTNNNPKNMEKMMDYNFEIGMHSKKILDANLVIISPGIPNSITILNDCKEKHIPIISEIEFASWFTTSPILALTGSNGKTTTVNLLYDMCITDGKNSLIGGNMGVPFSENVLYELTSKIKKIVHILEISSFQLENIQSFSPRIAGLLNISEDHMDRYGNLAEYSNVKIKLTKNMSQLNNIVYNRDDAILNKVYHNNKMAHSFSLNNQNESYFKLNSSKIFYDTPNKQKILLNLNETRLKGKHNLQNILAASTMAHIFGVSHNAIKDAIINFTPIPHRLEWIGNINNIDFINDSKATNLAATCAAIESFDQKLILIMGGTDKSTSDFTRLIPLLKERSKYIITYGIDGKSIRDQLQSKLNVNYIEGFQDAVLKASESANSGDTILLSPGCASYDQFSNYEERGKAFKHIFTKIELEL